VYSPNRISVCFRVRVKLLEGMVLALTPIWGWALIRNNTVCREQIFVDS